MLHEEKQEITQTVLKTVKTAVSCDLCKTRVEGASEHGEGAISWATKNYDVSQTCVAIRDGNAFPSGGSIDTLAVHVCPTCFTGKLLPWLKEQGAPEPHRSETDW